MIRLFLLDRFDESRNVSGVVRTISVNEYGDLSSYVINRCPNRITLAPSVIKDDFGTGLPGNFGGSIRRMPVHYEDLICIRTTVLDNRCNRPGFILRRNDHGQDGAAGRHAIL